MTKNSEHLILLYSYTWIIILKIYRELLNSETKYLSITPTLNILGLFLTEHLHTKITCRISLQKLGLEITSSRNSLAQPMESQLKPSWTPTWTLVFSATEYDVSTWLNSTHWVKVDVQLNFTMLPVLYDFHPPHIWRIIATTREWFKYSRN